MDLDYYELPYDIYAFFHPDAIANNITTTTIQPWNTDIEADQVQAPPRSRLDVTERVMESSNQYNRSIPV